MKRNAPGVKIRPVDQSTDPDTADVIDGLCRAVMNNGDSITAIKNAITYQVTAGIGFLKVSTDYIHDESMDQEIKLEQIENPFQVYFPLHLIHRPDYSDAPYCFIRYKMSKETFEARYPDAQTPNFERHEIGDDKWVEEDNIILAEYWTVDEVEKTLYQLSDGRCIISDKEPKPELGIEVINSRTTWKKQVTCRIITQYEVLEEHEWAGHYIPVIPVTGQLINISGKKHYISLVRFAKDPQKFYNYYHSSMAELMSLQPKAPYLAAAESGLENFPEWKTANTKPHAYLRYKTTDEMGNQLPPPSRQAPPTIGSDLVMGLQISTQNLKEVMGLFDANIGQRSNEVSGVAIQERNREGENAVYHFVDNLNDSMKYLGRILVDLIPAIYDVPRAVRVLGEDMADKVVQINKIHNDGVNPNRLYDLTTGKYDVFCDVGPSYNTKRVETAANMLKLVNSVPQFGMIEGDYLISLLDFPQADKVAARWRSFLQMQYPQLIQNDEMGLRASPEQLKAVIGQLQGMKQQDDQQKQQMQQVIQQLQQQLTQMKAQEIDRTAERQTRLAQEQIKAQAEIQKAQLGVQAAQIKTRADLSKHAVDTGVALHRINIEQVPPAIPAQNAEQFNQANPATQQTPQNNWGGGQ